MLSTTGDSEMQSMTHLLATRPVATNRSSSLDDAAEVSCHRTSSGTGMLIVASVAASPSVRNGPPRLGVKELIRRNSRISSSSSDDDDDMPRLLPSRSPAASGPTIDLVKLTVNDGSGHLSTADRHMLLTAVRDVRTPWRSRASSRNPSMNDCSDAGVLFAPPTGPLLAAAAVAVEAGAGAGESGISGAVAAGPPPESGAGEGVQGVDGGGGGGIPTLSADDETVEVTSIRELLHYCFEGLPSQARAPLAWAVASVVCVNTTLFMVALSIIVLVVDSMRAQEPNESALSALEAVFISWFILDYGVRFATSYNKLRFAKRWLNIIDIVTIIPYFVDLIFSGVDVSVLVFLRAFRLIRILRVFKLTKHSGSMGDVLTAMRKTRAALSLLGFLLSIALLVFSSAMYFAELNGQEFDTNSSQWIRDDGVVSPFQSIWHAVWWCIVTICTVGYGDAVPITGPGKIVATLTMLCGVLVLSFPTVILSASFHEAYTSRLTSNTMLNIALRQLTAANEATKLRSVREGNGDDEDELVDGRVQVGVVPTVAEPEKSATAQRVLRKEVRFDEQAYAMLFVPFGVLNSGGSRRESAVPARSAALRRLTAPDDFDAVQPFLLPSITEPGTTSGDRTGGSESLESMTPRMLMKRLSRAGSGARLRDGQPRRAGDRDSASGAAIAASADFAPFPLGQLNLPSQAALFDVSSTAASGASGASSLNVASASAAHAGSSGVGAGGSGVFAGTMPNVPSPSLAVHIAPSFVVSGGGSATSAPSSSEREGTPGLAGAAAAVGAGVGVNGTAAPSTSLFLPLPVQGQATGQGHTTSRGSPILASGSPSSTGVVGPSLPLDAGVGRRVSSPSGSGMVIASGGAATGSGDDPSHGLKTETSGAAMLSTTSGNSVNSDNQWRGSLGALLMTTTPAAPPTPSMTWSLSATNAAMAAGDPIQKDSTLRFDSSIAATFGGSRQGPSAAAESGHRAAPGGAEVSGAIALAEKVAAQINNNVVVMNLGVTLESDHAFYAPLLQFRCVHTTNVIKASVRKLHGGGWSLTLGLIVDDQAHRDHMLHVARAQYGASTVRVAVLTSVAKLRIQMSHSCASNPRLAAVLSPHDLMHLDSVYLSTTTFTDVRASTLPVVLIAPTEYAFDLVKRYLMYFSFRFVVELQHGRNIALTLHDAKVRTATRQKVSGVSSRTIARRVVQSARQLDTTTAATPVVQRGTNGGDDIKDADASQRDGEDSVAGGVAGDGGIDDGTAAPADSTPIVDGVIVRTPQASRSTRSLSCTSTWSHSPMRSSPSRAHGAGTPASLAPPTPRR